MSGSDVAAAAGPPPLVLASASPRRRELLARTGFTLAIRPAEVDETPLADEPPAAHVARLARIKAEVGLSVALGAGGPGPVGADASLLVLAADTVVVSGEAILGKPRDAEEARAMLAALSGAWHEVCSGWCVLRGDGARREGVVVTRVRFKALDPEELGWYLHTGEWQDKAGAYGIQGRGAFLVEQVQGSYTNVVGLPLAEVVDALGELGLRPAPLSAAARREEIVR